MRKLVKSIRTRILKIIPMLLAALGLLFSTPLSTAYAAPAVAAPVTAELIGELLVALGLMAGNATDGYTWISKDNPYVENVFESQVTGITSGVPVSSETLGSLVDTCIPKGVYYAKKKADGTHRFFVGENELHEVTVSDIFVKANSLVDVKYFLPTNFLGVMDYNVDTSGSVKRPYALFPTLALGTLQHYIPVVYSGDTLYVRFTSISFPSETSYTYTNLTTMNKGTYEHNFAGGTRLMPPVYDIDSEWGVTTASGFSWLQANSSLLHGNYVSSTGVSHKYDYAAGDVCTLIYTSDFPEYGVSGDKTLLEDSIVQVKPSEDDDNNGSTPPVPQSPNSWEIWQTVTQLLDELDSGKDTNGGTTYDQYVNNNYNLVDVDINVPDKIDNNVNLSGGLDINGTGDINITVHEDVSLPSAGDGSGFYNPNAADVIGALGKDNPVIPLISGLFSALDPALVGIFSISVSLLFVLGLWRLIRG